MESVRPRLESTASSALVTKLATWISKKYFQLWNFRLPKSIVNTSDLHKSFDADALGLCLLPDALKSSLAFYPFYWKESWCEAGEKPLWDAAVWMQSPPGCCWPLQDHILHTPQSVPPSCLSPEFSPYVTPLQWERSRCDIPWCKLVPLI